MTFPYFVDNMAISIVGGAEADLERSDGADYSVRINNHWEKQGGECDILFSCGMEKPSSREFSPHYLVIPFNAQKEKDFEELPGLCAYPFRWSQLRYHKPNPHGPQYEFMNRFNHTIGTMPLTGIAAINYFVHLPVRSIFITGMTMYLYGGHEIRRTADGQEQRWRDSHWLDPQVRWLKHLLTIDPRVSVDERLEELLQLESSLNGYTMRGV